MAEPQRKSVYDILMEHLKIAGRKTFVHRYLYVGEHKNETEIETLFQKIIKTINEGYCAERLTGLLLLYPNYFIHVIDGCEYAIEQHLHMIFEMGAEIVGNTRLLGFYHHVNQRFFSVWGVRRAKPPILLEKIDPSSNFEEVKRYLEICVKKVYNLAIELRSYDTEEEDHITIREVLPYMSQYLPEYNLLNFLLNSNDIYSMKPIAFYAEATQKVRYDLDLIWPVRNDFVPLNVFDLEFNPVDYLQPNHGK